MLKGTEKAACVDGKAVGFAKKPSGFAEKLSAFGAKPSAHASDWKGLRQSCQHSGQSRQHTHPIGRICGIPVRVRNKVAIRRGRAVRVWSKAGNEWCPRATFSDGPFSRSGGSDKENEKPGSGHGKSARPGAGQFSECNKPGCRRGDRFRGLARRGKLAGRDATRCVPVIRNHSGMGSAHADPCLAALGNVAYREKSATYLREFLR